MNYFILGAGLALLGVAHAGHEFPFYPSFYPQEITVEALDARSAAQRLAKGTLHAYAGGDITDSGKSGVVTSLGGYVVAKLEPGRCADARGMKDALGAGAVWHPYPVTPFHADYLHHADRAEAARATTGEQIKFSGKLEIIDVGVLTAKASRRYNGWSGPPWLRQGWFHAYLLLAPAVTDVRIENAARRLMRGDYRGLEERINLERNLVDLLQARCERVVLGYTVRRERYGADYSQGVENVGYDALEGLASAIFPRTVKLRDFPWNGWLNVAAPAPPSSAWNPLVGGFGDVFGRLVWSTLSDPALLPSPHGGGWIENRVSASVEKSEKGFAVPEDALFSAGRGKTATTRIVYRVRNSAFHDGTSMSFADLVYAYAFTNPEQLRGVRLLRVDTETLAFGEDKLSYEVAVLAVFRDPTYPKGIGSFNAYAVPLKAHVTRIERRGYGAEVHTETEWLERLGRDTRIVRGSFAAKLAERLSAVAPPAPVCHYLLIARDGAVAAAGAVRAGAEGTCRLQLKTPGYRLMVAAVLEDSTANAPIRHVPWE